jgi:hypothetical protein
MKNSFIAIIVIYIAILSFGYWGYEKYGNWKILEAWIPFMIILPLLYLWIIYFSPIFIAKSKLNKNDFDNGYYEITNESFTYYRDDGSITKRPFSSITRIMTGKDYFIFWENLISIYILPYSAFKSKDDIEQLHAILSKYNEST